MRVLRAFEAAGLEYVLIGATAMAFHGVIRATADLAISSFGRRRRMSNACALLCERLSREIPISTQSHLKNCLETIRPCAMLHRRAICTSLY
jgi:hypothetical protein